MLDPSKLKAIKASAEALGGGADLLFYTGDLRRFVGHSRFQVALKKRTQKKTKLILALSTFGGSPAEAYKIARSIRQSYQRFAVWIPFFCKSAGTLVGLGADEIIMSDGAELGPLDVQVRKPDELEEFGSGLDIKEALTFLEGRAQAAFLDTLETIRDATALSTKLAGDMSSGLMRYLYGRIFSQIDPVRLGEVSRAMRIGEEYAKRLARRPNNLKNDAIPRLVVSYPSHDFVIDREEASELFRSVRGPTEHESRLEELVAPWLKQQVTAEYALVNWLEDLPPYVSALEQLAAAPEPEVPAGTQAQQGVPSTSPPPSPTLTVANSEELTPTGNGAPVG